MILDSGEYYFVIERDGFVNTIFSYNIINQSDLNSDEYQYAGIMGIPKEKELQNNYSIDFSLQWGGEPKDLDTHFEVYEGENKITEVWYKQKTWYDKNINKNIILEEDITSSFGPEFLHVNLDNEKKYKYYVYNYSGNNEKLSKSDAKVTIENDENAICIIVPKNKSGLNWEVATIVNGELYIENSIY